MLGGVVLGVIFALIFQPDLLDQLIAQEKFHNTYQLIIQAVGSRMTLSTGVSEVDELLTTARYSLANYCSSYFRRSDGSQRILKKSG